MSNDFHNLYEIEERFLPGPKWNNAWEAIDDLRSVDPDKARGLVDIQANGTFLIHQKKLTPPSLRVKHVSKTCQLPVC